MANTEYSVYNELQYTVKQNKGTIENQVKKLEQYLRHLKTALETDRIGEVVTTWTEGFVSRDVTELASTISRQKALLEAIAVINEAAADGIPMK